MGRCDEDSKRAAVLNYLEGNRGFKTVAREHDIDPFFASPVGRGVPRAWRSWTSKKESMGFFGTL